LGVTAPPVASAMRSAVSRDTQLGPSLQSAVMLAGERPTASAKAERFVPVRLSQFSSFTKFHCARSQSGVNEKRAKTAQKLQ
jgi:hypothetical protein